MGLWRAQHTLVDKLVLLEQGKVVIEVSAAAVGGCLNCEVALEITVHA